MIRPFAAAHAPRAARWYRDPVAWRLIGTGYVPWLAGLNLAWEIAQLPLYTIWSEAAPGYLAFSVAHCTSGDVAIGAALLVCALVVVRAGPLDGWRWGKIALIATLAGVGYTALSEWMNTVLLHNWSYSDLMPTITLGGVELGVSPLLQWLFLPPLALWIARGTQRA